MNLKGLIYRELGDGLTEKELAAAVGVSPRTIIKILADKLPKEPAVWKKFAKYFRMDADFLRTGRLVNVTEPCVSEGAVPMRKVPLLTWTQVGQMMEHIEPSTITNPEALLLATDIAGARTFALRVKDDSMYPMFGEGEIIFVNPDIESEPGQYVVAAACDSPESGILRELNMIGDQYVLHPLNRRYKDMPLTKAYCIWGKVVRLRKNL
ncbi:MAG: LexA family protein [Nitrospiraceae bacterium]